MENRRAGRPPGLTGPKPRLWPVIAATLLGAGILCGLGAWQVNRLAWKQDLLAQLAANQSAEPVDLATAEARRSAGGNIAFLKVAVRGKFRHDAAVRMISVYDGGPGWNIITPLVTGDGRAVLIDRGLAPDAVKDRIDRPSGEVEVTGIVRFHVGRRGSFDPDNDVAANRWYWWDIPAMISAAKLPAGTTAADFILQALPDGEAKGFPEPQRPQANLKNNHLSYAITWFALALVLLVISGLYVRGLMTKTTA